MRRLTISALFALSLALTATGQPPNHPKGKPADDKKAEKKPDPADAAIAAALANDADVKMAQAKMQLAEAELVKARFAVTQKVFAAQSAMQQAKLTLATNELELANTRRYLEAERVPNPELHPSYRVALDKVALAKTKLAAAEVEWKLLTGGPGASRVVVNLIPGLRYEAVVQEYWLDERKLYLAEESRAAVKGPVADRLRAALDKPVKLRGKLDFPTVIDGFRQGAGLDVPFRLKTELEPITSEGETLPVGAWLQLFLDSNRGVVMVVREYGVLVTVKESAPPDAIGIIDFWKQKPPAKEAKAETTTGKP